MSGKHRKRAKKKRPSGGRQPAPVIHRYQAVVRGPLAQWWHDKKRSVKIIAAVVSVAFILIWLLLELAKLVFG